MAVVQSDMTDIGGGTYTILTQVAAEGLGLPWIAVPVELGRSDFRVGGHRRTWGAANSSTAVYRACRAVREKLAASACRETQGPRCTGGTAEAAVLSGGRVVIGAKSEALSEIVARDVHSQGRGRRG